MRGTRLAGLLASAAVALWSSPLHASLVSERLGKVAHDLTDGYVAKRPGIEGETLAVFTFRCPPDLEKRQVGYAVAELLMTELAPAGKYKVVERTEMKRVLEEHALSFTGAMDSDSTVRVGKLLGAKLGVMGSVDPLGNQYQVNARLVDLESGEVLATAFQELPRETFEAEAKSYLALVPDEQAIGVYLTGGLGVGMRHTHTPSTALKNSLGETTTAEVSNPEMSAMFSGLGLRYLVLPWLTLDATAWLGWYGGALGFIKKGNGIGSSPVPFHVHMDSRAGEFGAYWTRKVGPRFRALAGLAVVKYGFSIDAGDEWTLSFNGQSSAKGVTAVIRGGVEWRPRGRFGLGVSAFFYPAPPRIPVTFSLDPNWADAVTIAELRLPPVGGQASIALYF